MRRDIAKVVFERPKASRTWAAKTPRPPRAALDREGEQIGEASIHIRRRRQKMRNRNLGPLMHFLAGWTGQPWSRLWSEISWDRGTGRMRSGPVRGFYVHPRSGLLLYAGEVQ